MNYLRALLIFISTSLLISCSKPEIGITKTYKQDNLSHNVVNITDSSITDSGIAVTKGNYVKISNILTRFAAKPRKYRVIVKVDPRFEDSLNFIARYDYKTKKYITLPYWSKDIPTEFKAKLESLIAFQDNNPGINLNEGDVVSLKIVQASEFFDSSMKEGYSDTQKSNNFDVSSLFTQSGIDNAIIDTPSINRLCGFNPTYCNNRDNLKKDGLLGYSVFNVRDITKCNDENPEQANSFCVRRDGAGLRILLNGENLKEPKQEFINYKDKKLYQVHVKEGGVLSFGYMYSTADVIFDSTTKLQTPFQRADQIYQSFQNYSSEKFFNDVLQNATIERFISGRYLLEIEVGSGTQSALIDMAENITKRYYIKSAKNRESQTLDNGVIIGDQIEFNASSDGFLFYGIENATEDMEYTYSFKGESYNGKVNFSNAIYENLVLPTITNIRNSAAKLFSGISSNGKFTISLNAILTLYILISGFLFALGSLKMTVNELFARVLKVTIVSMLFSTTSYKFFNDYLFSFFDAATNELFRNVTNSTSKLGNPFGFIDPIFNKYLNSDLWLILGYYILHFWKGYIICAFFIILGIFYMLRALVIVILGYVMAYFSLCVVISLGPIFITCMLFERTRKIFDNWLNIMFGFILQPTFALIFVLFIDQLSSSIFNGAELKVISSVLLPLDFSYPDLGLNFSIGEIRGYKPVSPSIEVVFKLSAIFYSMMLLMSKVTELSTNIADMLAGGGGMPGAVASGGSDMTSEVSNIHNNIIPQKYRDGLSSLKGLPYAMIKSNMRNAMIKKHEDGDSVVVGNKNSKNTPSLQKMNSPAVGTSSNPAAGSPISPASSSPSTQPLSGSSPASPPEKAGLGQLKQAAKQTKVKN
jgi:type IV secretion system protein VirB6